MTARRPFAAMLAAIGVHSPRRAIRRRRRIDPRARLLREIESSRQQAYRTNNGMSGHMLQPRQHRQR